MWRLESTKTKLISEMYNNFDRSIKTGSKKLFSDITLYTT